MANTYFSQANWDTKDSTFMHNFYYSCGWTIPGYSKKDGFAESKDKRSLLARLLIRLYKKKYFNTPKVKEVTGKFMYVEIFKNCSKNGWIQIATLHTDYMDINNDYLDPDLGNMLWCFEKQRAVGNIDSFEAQFCKRKKLRVRVDNLALKPRFYEKLQLQNHCKRLLNQDLEPVGLVQEFYRKYCIEFFNSFTDEDQKFYDSLKYYKP